MQCKQEQRVRSLIRWSSRQMFEQFGLSDEIILLSCHWSLVRDYCLFISECFLLNASYIIPLQMNYVDRKLNFNDLTNLSRFDTFVITQTSACLQKWWNPTSNETAAVTSAVLTSYPKTSNWKRCEQPQTSVSWNFTKDLLTLIHMEHHLNQVLVIMFGFIQYFINTVEALKSSLTSPWLVTSWLQKCALLNN